MDPRNNQTDKIFETARAVDNPPLDTASAAEITISALGVPNITSLATTALTGWSQNTRVVALLELTDPDLTDTERRTASAIILSEVDGYNLTNITVLRHPTDSQVYPSGTNIRPVIDASQMKLLYDWGITEHDKAGNHTDVTAKSLVVDGVNFNDKASKDLQNIPDDLTEQQIRVIKEKLGITDEEESDSAYQKIHHLATQEILSSVSGVASSAFILDPTIISLEMEPDLPEGVTETSGVNFNYIGIPTTAPPNGVNCVIVEVSESSAATEPYFSSAIPWMNTWGREIVKTSDNDAFFYVRATTDTRDRTALLAQKNNQDIPIGTIIRWYYGRF